MSNNPNDPDPISTLRIRASAELSAVFDFNKPTHFSSAPGSLDVMGGIAHWAGSLVCAAPLACSAAVLMQERQDRELQIFSFNRFDENQPFTFRMSLDRMAKSTAHELRAGFAEPGRTWAGYIAGCLFLLHERKLIDLNSSAIRGMNLAVYSTVPMHAGVGSSSAVTAATLLNLVDFFSLHNQLDTTKLAVMCQEVESKLIGTTSSIASHLTTCCGEGVAMVRMLCQPHELQPPLRLPAGFRIIGIDSGVRADSGQQELRARAAAQTAHAMILAKMREFGTAAGKELLADPMNGYLANLDQDDYKKFFRPYLPDDLQHAADHHILEARRVRQFCEFIEQAAELNVEDRARYTLMDKAGHLMYASHLSYMNDAFLGNEECDRIVDLVKSREKAGLYGARITGRGCGGTVVVLCETGETSERAILDIVSKRAELQERYFAILSTFT